MKTGKTYKQIFIESNDDLPKEDGYYFCNRNGFNSYQRLLHDPPDKSYMREIRWYLLEQLEQEIQRGIPFNCPECGREIQYGLSNECKRLILTSKLFQSKPEPDKLTGEMISAKLDECKFETSKEREDAYDLINKTNFMQWQDLTDEEWMALTKEEILQLYKNCYAMLEGMIKGRDKVQPLPDNRKTAEEILFKHTCCMNPYKKHEIIDAMEDYVNECRKEKEESKDEAYNNSFCRCDHPVFIQGVCELCGGFQAD